MSALTVFLYPTSFQKDGKPVAAYAFPLFFLGSVLLCTGMFLCAFIIERSTKEFYLRPNKPSKIYWLQPGGQHIGEQVFSAFLDVNEGPRSQASTDIQYVKSTRHEGHKVDHIWLVFTVLLTVLGWVIQFVGLRGLNAAVSLAQMGSTLLMALVRTWLRTKRIGSDDSRLTQEECRLSSHKKQELDCFAFHLEGVESFNLRANFADDVSRAPSSLSSVTATAAEPDTSAGPGIRLIQTRVRLAELTSNAEKSGIQAWHDLPIRIATYRLAKTIETTMDLLSRWTTMASGVYYFTLPFECLSQNEGTTVTSLEQITLKIERSENKLKWTVDVGELEAILGLWTWSLLKSNESWLQPELGRLVGLHEEEARAEETDLYFHKWIFCETRAEMVSSSVISSSRQLFGFYSDSHPEDMDILVVKTKNGLEEMAAQDIYIHFLNNILEGRHLSDQAQVLSGPHGHLASSHHLDELVQCFRSGYLGSREDALLCIVPVLRRRHLLPDLAADTPTVLQQIDGLVTRGQWSDAFSIVRWLCKRCEGSEFERSAFELGRLCHRAIVHKDPDAEKHGYYESYQILQADSRSDYFKKLNQPLDRFRKAGWMDSRKERQWWKQFSMQVGWVAWHLFNRRDLSKRAALEKLGANAYFNYTSDKDMSERDLEQIMSALFSWLTIFPEARPSHFSKYDLSKEQDLQCLRLVNLNGLTSLRHWLMVQWAEVCKLKCAISATAFEYAARSGSDSAIETLCRHGLDINDAENPGVRTALMNVVSLDDKDATAMILAHGSKLNVCHKRVDYEPVFLMARSPEVMAVLLEYGADIESTDRDGNTAFHLACGRDDCKSASFLLEKGASIKTFALGMTPLTCAAQRDSPRMVEFLLDHGADIDVKSRNGRTPLMTAACEPSPDALRVLLERRADIYLGDNENRTVFGILNGCDESLVKETKAILEEHYYKEQQSSQEKTHADSREQ